MTADWFDETGVGGRMGGLEILTHTTSVPDDASTIVLVIVIMTITKNRCFKCVLRNAVVSPTTRRRIIFTKPH